MPAHDRWMALDVGHKRIGVALSDPLKTFARPLTSLQRKNLQTDVEAILKLISAYEVSCLVVGLPLHLDGRPAKVSAHITPLVEALGRQGSLAVKWCDERLSSKEAEELMAELKVPIQDRRKLRDAYAAAVILNRFIQEGSSRQ